VIYEAFYRWCKYQNKELSYAGYVAMEAFLKQVPIFAGIMFCLFVLGCCVFLDQLLFIDQ